MQLTDLQYKTNIVYYHDYKTLSILYTFDI